MGNSDLIIIINDNETFLIKGVDYNNREEAIKKAIDLFIQRILDVKKIADFPEQIEERIDLIRVFIV